MSKRLNLKGKRFGSWLVIEFDEERHVWITKCDCGTIGHATSNNLTSGKSTRCAKCRNTVVGKKNSTHNLSKTRLYGIWNGMKQRCSNQNRPKYNIYGGRGIKVCEEWNDFTNFYTWAMDNGYEDGLSIDRIDVDRDYEPNNCRWCKMKQQSNNRSNNRKIEYNGETKTLSEWAEKFNIGIHTLKFRLNSGWEIERALTEPAYVGKNQTYTENCND